MSPKEYQMNSTPKWVWVLVSVLGLFAIFIMFVMIQAFVSSLDDDSSYAEVSNPPNKYAESSSYDTVNSNKTSQKSSVLERDKDEILSNINKPSITVDGNASEAEINVGEHLKEEFMNDYNVTYLADKKTYVLTPAHQLELETILMTVTNRDIFAWNSVTSLVNTYSQDVASNLGSQYQVALMSNIYGEMTLLYRAKNGQVSYDYMKN